MPSSYKLVIMLSHNSSKNEQMENYTGMKSTRKVTLRNGRWRTFAMNKSPVELTTLWNAVESKKIRM